MNLIQLSKKFWLTSWNLVISFFSLLIEMFLSAIYLPSYLTNFLRGLRSLNDSYGEVSKAMEGYKKILKERDLEKTFGNNTNAATEFIRNYNNEILRLKKEQEGLFSQLFSSFIAAVALIISIIALITK